MPAVILPEIYVEVASTLREDDQLATLSSVMRTTRAMYELLYPHVYKELTITKTNASGIFWGILPHASEGNEEAQNEIERDKLRIGEKIRRSWSLWPDVALIPEDVTELESDETKKWIS
ncbi:uncharacterized protein L201_004871 [Kwoniella dendrophila CBS 6074]|uniref:F-box domain-containing protein n=1 Tax=Kwoniella dendrophila CBS 6074 TaxID=1295534 RepID=A0AAX4JX22_9TREE